MPQVRAAALASLDRVAGQVGLEPRALLRDAHLDPSLLADPERLLPFRAVSGLLEGAARQSGCDHFGLLMAEERSLASFGPLSLLLRHVDRVGDVARALVHYQRLFGGGIRLESDALDGGLLVRLELADATGNRQGTELALASFCRCIATVLGRPWRPESVHFVHSAPADSRPHQRVFGCPIDFESDFNGIVLGRDALQQANPSADGELVGHAEKLLGLIVTGSVPSSASERVRRSLRLLLPEQRGTFDDVAWDLALKPRSLQRLLEREGARYGALLNEIRRELALRHLATSCPVALVANLTGYRRASSFTRWFRAEFGMPPAEWRERAVRSASHCAPPSETWHLVRGLTGMVDSSDS